MRTAIKKSWTIRRTLEWAIFYLKENGIESPRLNAEILLSYTLKKTCLDLYLEFDQLVNSSDFVFFKELILRRSDGVPSSYLTEEQEFMSLKFKVVPGVYIPRPETEILVEEIIRAIQDSRLKGQSRNEMWKPFIIVDLGTGCGNIVISLVERIKDSKAYAIDISREALNIAIENARFHNLEERITFLRGDMFSPLNGLNLEGMVDLIISNPPYIAAEDMKSLPAEIKNEPRVALEGGEDGLSFYRRIIPKAPKFLNEGGLFSLEVGYNQAKEVKMMILSQRKLGSPVVIRDYDGVQRMILTRRR